MQLLVLCLTCAIFVFAETNSADHPKQCLPTKLDWDKMIKSGSSPKTSIDFVFDSNRFEFDFKIELEYIGSSTSRTSLRELGTNYMIDFVSFKTSDSVNKPNTNCANRISSSYNNRNWDEWWKYSLSPWIDQHIGSDEYLAYSQPSSYWTISYLDINYNKNSDISDDEYMCGPLLYHAHFTLSQLMNCQNKNGLSIIKIKEDDNNYYLSGTLYVSIVAPIGDKIKDFYKVYMIDSRSFEIKIAKSIDIINTMSNFV